MGAKDSGKMMYELAVHFASNTPVVGCQMTPNVGVRALVSSQETSHSYSISFTWYREQTCSMHESELATFQCMSCVRLNIPVKESYHCSKKCFLNSCKKHMEIHSTAAKTATGSRNNDQQGSRKLSSCGFWPDFGNSFFDEIQEVVVREGRCWVKVGSSKTYLPTMADVGLSLRMECTVAECSTGNCLSATQALVTDPVIAIPTYHPRQMFQIKMLKSCNFNPEAQLSDDMTFRVLSYNILSDMYAKSEMYSYCPTWALAWEYRRQNLLQEIIEYDADIICLQEVQSDHFENFFKPELTKHGYSVMYKEKLRAINIANQHVIDGCATFFRCDRFKEIVKYELEFDKPALSLVEALEPSLKCDGIFRLMKGNVALVVILDVLEKGSPDHASQSRICVVNTHIHDNPELLDVKLCQVATLVHGLEKIFLSQVPLLICGDFNSLPGSDPHRLLVRGKIDSGLLKKETDPLGVYRLLKLQHSMPLASAYASIFRSERVEQHHLRRMDKNNNEPLFTNFGSGFSGTLDYILYTVNNLRVVGLLELLDHQNVGVGLPSPLWSSDHIALMASFRLKRTWNLPLPSNPWQQVEKK